MQDLEKRIAALEQHAKIVDKQITTLIRIQGCFVVKFVKILEISNPIIDKLIADLEKLISESKRLK